MTTCNDRKVPAVDHPVFDHDGPWTEDAYLALPSDGRIELVDGTLVVGPGTTEHRATVVSRVRDAVQAALPTALRLLGPVPLRLGPDCILVPDLVVTAARAEGDGGDPDVLDAAAALMVIEVVGHDHGGIDRVFKPQLYARSRIPYSLLIDHDGPFGIAEMIIGGRYHEYARATGGEPLRIEEPFVMEIDLEFATRPEEPAPATN
jgi:Protein of unknown function (DUF820).